MSTSVVSLKKPKKNRISYDRWGYIFLIPFFLVFTIFTLIPLASTFYYSFFEMYRDGLNQIGPNFVGFDNYAAILKTDVPKFFGNTIIMWVMGFIPQIVVSLVLAFWFTDLKLRVKAKGFFKVVIYMPNLIMATAFAMLFFALFSDRGPINNLLIQAGLLEEPFRFLSSVWGTRSLVAVMNFMMWYGNTTILLMSGMLGIDTSLFEAAQIDGASSPNIFFKITMPLLKPIFLYVLLTSLIGGLQMFDVPQILTNRKGDPVRTSMTIIMNLSSHLTNKNFGKAGALSVILFFVTAIIGFFMYRIMTAERADFKKKSK